MAVAVGFAAVSASAQTLDYREIICGYTDWDCGKAMRVAFCESSMDPRAYSSGQYGLFQVSYRWHSQRVSSPSDLYDPETNIRIAHEIYLQSGGWGPWPVCGLR